MDERFSKTFGDTRHAGKRKTSQCAVSSAGGRAGRPRAIRPSRTGRGPSGGPGIADYGSSIIIVLICMSRELLGSEG